MDSNEIDVFKQSLVDGMESLCERLADFLSQRSIFTVPELTQHLNCTPPVARATLHKLKEKGEIQISYLRRRDGSKIYYKTPTNDFDRTGFFIRHSPELRFYFNDIPFPYSVTERAVLMRSLGVVEDGSIVECVLTKLSDGEWHTTFDLAQTVDRPTLNMPVTLRKVTPTLPLFGLKIAMRPSEAPRHYSGRAQNEYQLKKIALFSPVEDYFISFHERLLAVAKSILHDNEKAQELVAKVREKFLRKSKEGFFDKIDVRLAYVAQSVRNAALNAIRYEKRFTDYDPNLDLGSEASDDQTPDSVMELSEAREVLLSALSELPEEIQRILLMRYFEGLDVNRIAEIMNINPITVGTKIFRAQVQLKTIFSEKGYDDLSAFF